MDDLDRLPKTQAGNFFEDFRLGQMLRHATPRTLGEGDRALYGALYPTRFALTSSDAFARACGLAQAPLDPLIGFHVGFGKTVPDISLNAVANLGYADCRILRPLHPGDEISAVSEVIGLKQTSSGTSGIVWVRSTANDARGEPVVSWVRWVLVRKADPNAPAPTTHVPTLPDAVPAEALAVPPGLDFTEHDDTLSGSPHRWEDYTPGEIIDHLDGVTVQEAEHMMATRLWQNTARVHFDARMRQDGRPLIYGGHVISLARALSFNGLANAHWIAAINGGSHVAPCFAGDTVYARSEVLEKAPTDKPTVGALRLRLVAVKGAPAGTGPLTDATGRHRDGVLLDLDYWALMPRRMA